MRKWKFGEVRAVIRQSHDIARGCGCFIRATNPGMGTDRLIIVIPKRIANAVTRNHIKRRFKAAFRAVLLTSNTQRDYVIFVRSIQSRDVDFSKLCLLFRSIVTRDTDEITRLRADEQNGTSAR